MSIKLSELQSQIQKLEKQAAEIRAKEFAQTLQSIVTDMNAFGITLADIKRAMGGKTAKGKVVKTSSSASKTKGKRTSSLAGAKVAPKYRGPAGETWTGRGVPPRWMAEALKAGKNKEDFLIQPNS